MGNDHLSLEQLIDTGWAINESTAVEMTQFASVNFCLNRDGHEIICVEGFGPTRDEALFDAMSQANDWHKADAAERG